MDIDKKIFILECCREILNFIPTFLLIYLATFTFLTFIPLKPKFVNVNIVEGYVIRAQLGDDGKYHEIMRLVEHEVKSSIPQDNR